MPTEELAEAAANKSGSLRLIRAPELRPMDAEFSKNATIPLPH